MKHIYLEKESIYRAVADFLFGTVMGAVSILCLCVGNNIMLCALFALFCILLFFSGIMEFKTDIAYDSERMNIRNGFFHYTVEFSDIRKIERIFIRTLRMGHWRWYVITDTGKITVPFPDSLGNAALCNLLSTIQTANPDVKMSF